MKLDRRLKKIILFIIKCIILYLMIFSIYKINFYYTDGKYRKATKNEFISLGLNSIYEKKDNKLVLIKEKIPANTILIFSIYIFTIIRAQYIYIGFYDLVRNRVDNLKKLLKEILKFYLKPVLLEIFNFLIMTLIFIKFNNLSGTYSYEFGILLLKMILFYINLPIWALFIASNFSIYIILLFMLSFLSGIFIENLPLIVVILIYFLIYYFIYIYIKYKEEKE